jgi:hypothetical protein
MSVARGPGLTCPRCGHGETDVVDSRPQGGMVRRRRRCQSCCERFTTREVIVGPEDDHSFGRVLALHSLMLRSAEASGQHRHTLLRVFHMIIAMPTASLELAESLLKSVSHHNRHLPPPEHGPARLELTPP